MKKTTLLLISLLFFFSHAHAAEEKKKDPSFWEKIRTKIEKITPKQKPTATTAVGGVRGAKHSSEDLYWKGEEKTTPIGIEELTDFEEALQLAEQHERDKSIALFQEFLKKYPHSLLAEDAKNALKELENIRQ